MTQMPVSLAMLYEPLSQRLPAVLRAKHNKRCIHDVRAYCPSLPMRPDFVYVREGENTGTLIQHESGFIEVRAPLADTLNILMDLFAEFQEMYEQLQNALLNSNPFQSISKVAYQILRCPVMITSNVFRILGIAGEDEGIPWEYSKNTGFSPPAYVNYYTHPSRYNAYMNGTQPLLQKLPSYCNWPGVLRVNCFFRGEAKCRLVVKLLTTEQSAGFIQMAEQIASVVEQIPGELEQKYFFDQYANNPYVSESGQPLKCKNPLMQRLQTVIGAQRYLLCRIRPVESQSNATEVYWIYSRLESQDTGSVQYLFQNSVILLLPWEPHIKRTLSHILSEMLQDLNLLCLVSNPCVGLDRIQDCIHQTDRLFEVLPASKSGIVCYETYEQQCLIREIKENMDSDIWLSSGLDTLIAYDRMKNTDYYNTLRCLTRNHFAQTVTAAELFIHRNSLQYRIAKIEELLGRDLSAPETQFFITLSVLLKEA